MSETVANVDPAEIEKFAAMAQRWWDPDGDSRPLHDINPLRVNFIAEHAKLVGARVLDVGCGGGLLAEALAERGAHVTGIDMAEASLKVAKLHGMESGTQVDYRHITAEALAEEAPGRYDLVCCLEMLEHVPQPEQVVQACAKLAKPGAPVVFSTINRTPKSFLGAIVAAEYLLGLLPRGTHEYMRLIRPSELGNWARDAGLSVEKLTGMHYLPGIRRAWLANDVDVNYLMLCRRHAEEA
jgi:2-polyprenyl-6-hydroxyphenyl methylase/3-demethylubiquinone-9 3-methyltransferase